MYVEIENARNLVYKAAWLKTTVRIMIFRSYGKITCFRSCNETTVEAVQIHGGYGYVKEYHVERLMRDAKITQIYEGTSEIQNVLLQKIL